MGKRVNTTILNLFAYSCVKLFLLEIIGPSGFK